MALEEVRADPSSRTGAFPLPEEGPDATAISGSRPLKHAGMPRLAWGIEIGKSVKRPSRAIEVTQTRSTNRQPSGDRDRH